MCDNEGEGILPQIISPGDAKTIQETAKAVRKTLEVVEKSGKFAANILGPSLKELVGLTLEDPLSYARFRARAWYDRRVQEILRKRGKLGKTKPVSPSIAIPLLEAAQDETREELREIWAKLIANAMDPDRSKGVRRSIIDAVKGFEPLETLVLQEFNAALKCGSAVSKGIEKRLDCLFDEVEASVMNLEKLGCITKTGNDFGQKFVMSCYRLNGLGREIIRVCSL